MNRKIIAVLLCVALLFALSAVFTACDEEPEQKFVVLGDSIAEGILGPSPLSERENYSYCAVVGKRNNYEYINRAVSGHKVAGLLEVLEAESEDSKMVLTNVKTADVIMVSILGNDLLQNQLGELILNVANNDLTTINGIIDSASVTFGKVIVKLREMNPNCTLFIQTVYNPVYPGCTTVSQIYLDALAEKGYDTAGVRTLADKMLDMLNGIVKNYLVDHPDTYYVIDVNAEFERIRKSEGETRAMRLFYPDWVHPSSEGHAVIADLTQAKLEELGLANAKTAVKEYKELRIEQLERMFSGSVDVAAVKKQIKKASSCYDITKIYFDAIESKTPIYC